MTITLRNPTFSSVKSAATAFEAPSIAWLTETWHVTHSTLPIWKSKRNVRIQYTPLPPSDPSLPAERTDRIDDLVTYQGLTGTKVSSVRGIDSAASGSAGGEWDWRGKGWLRIASSHWEVLGWGEEGDTTEGSSGKGGNKWAVTMFAKTLFTPAGIDIYSRDAQGLSESTLKDVKAALAASEDEMVRHMADTLFEVKVDLSGE